MDLKKFYLENISEQEYHYKFYKTIVEIKQEFEVCDTEDAIIKFKELCQPDVSFETDEENCRFYLLIYYLYKLGYEIKEFPRLFARPPEKPLDFVYTAIRNRLISEKRDDNRTVRYSERRLYVDELTFVQKETNIKIEDSIKQKFIEISTRQASFEEMSTDEKLAEIANLLENLLKKDGEFRKLDYSKICMEFISNESIKTFRKKLHCFRHATDTSLEERNSYTEKQKGFFIDYGLTIIKVINDLLKSDE